ncbi:PadR family transcriptional regulator [Actinotignum schaalii]|uniref:PadR family transcriptional regulator n=1 Tax=Actinotignum schaalii TaxID=59505 RepID=UPI000416675C|nr:PadR family transcriptional regulator [Actinotignum schaalii]AIE82750.1 PadR family transcriptional regulator [Actinotignum schaalii]WQN44856.1 PadR family transcriptional regulator [Actinotignum schaalii]
MEVQYAFLGLLTREPNYGYELKKLYDRYFAGDKPILAGQVYATLARLARDAKVAQVDDHESSGGPSRTRYALTTTGEHSLREWLATPEVPALALQEDLYFKTILSLLVTGDASGYLKAQRATHQQRMRELTARKQNAPLAEKLLLDSAIFHIEADLRWIQLTSSRLDQLKEEL